MQTFLPYSDFVKSAKCLDRQRLGKQRVECLQLLNAIAGTSKGWVNHPCTKMWKDNPESLLHYSVVICFEWRSRGYKDSCLEKIENLGEQQNWKIDLLNNPTWLGREDIHASHRSNLLRKLPSHYQQFGWSEPDNLLYVWI